MAALTRAVSAVTIVSVNSAKIFHRQNSYTQGLLQRLVRNFRHPLLRRYEILEAGICWFSESARLLILEYEIWGKKTKLFIKKSAVLKSFDDR